MWSSLPAQLLLSLVYLQSFSVSLPTGFEDTEQVFGMPGESDFTFLDHQTYEDQSLFLDSTNTGFYGWNDFFNLQNGENQLVEETQYGVPSVMNPPFITEPENQPVAASGTKTTTSEASEDPGNATHSWMYAIAKRLLEQEEREEREAKRNRIDPAQPSKSVADAQTHDSPQTLNMANVDDLSFLLQLMKRLDFGAILEKCNGLRYFNGRLLERRDIIRIYQKYIEGYTVIDLVVVKKLSGDNALKIIKTINDQFIKQGIVTSQEHPHILSTFGQIAAQPDSFPQIMQFWLDKFTNINLIPEFGLRSKRKKALTLDEMKQIFFLYIQNGGSESIAEIYDIAPRTVLTIMVRVSRELKSMRRSLGLSSVLL